MADKYKKLTQREHILLRPDTYIGSVHDEQAEMYVFDNNKILLKNIIYNPGLYKIYDEIIVNAIDHVTRMMNDKKEDRVTKIDVEIQDNVITVKNNGKSIPIEKHPEYNVYIPDLIFGELLTSQNYDDSEERIVGGKNGLGSKCISPDTKVLLFNGEIKYAKDIKIGDELIGDDGTKRIVLSKIHGKGKMYEIKQHYGESYKVNENHILTLHMPDHKVIFWNTNGWKILWWDFQNKCIRAKFFKAFEKELITCQECLENLSSNLKRHYHRKHKNIPVPTFHRKLPTKIPDMTNPYIIQAYNDIVKFSETISDNNVFDISIQDYLKLNPTTKSRLAGVRGNCVEWSEQKIELDPYILGLWLGDGMKSGYSYACEDSIDPQIIEYWEKWCLENDAKIKKQAKCKFNIVGNSCFKKKGKSPLKQKLNYYNLINNKHIPKDYLINSRDIRLKVLAGIIDTDGYVSRDGSRVVITQGFKHKKLVDDIIYLVRSLGFYCSVTMFYPKYTLKDEQRYSIAWKMNISGNIQDIPTILPRKKCKNTKSHNTDKSTGKISIKEIKSSDYIGIHIDGNERFLINDFTVTHNCTNIYSKNFTVEVGNNGQKYKRIYSDNMTTKSKEKITSYSGSDYVKITFEPDYERFGVKGLSDDMLSLFKKRVYDISACTPKDVKVTFNKETIKIKTFEDYVGMYLGDTKKVTMKCDRWEVVVCGSEDKFQHVSFVNGICTFQGGKHVDYISQQLVDGLYPLLIKKNKDLTIKKPFIKNYLFVFVKCNIVNPDFQGQTKEMLKTNKSKFGSTCELDKSFMDKVMKLDIMDEIIRFAMFKEEKDLKKQDGKKRNRINIPNYDGAIYAGQKNKSQLCTLILTEGLSAKGMAMNGLSALDKEQRKYYGTFSLKGKLLNVRDCSINKLSANDEMSHLKQILGLEHKKEYNNVNDLRYGKVMIMTDSDVDGYHIRSLLFNMFSVLWPSLFKFPNFLESFLTPIVKARKGKDEKSFYSLEKFRKWYQTNKNWKIKYYKGLGTSTKEEAKEYFKHLEKNRIKFHHVPEADKSFDLAFNKKKADERKEWLMNYNPDVDVNYEASISLDDIIHKNLIHFSIDDLGRSIPHLMDGLKISQRKVLFTCFKRNLTNEIKVAQLAGSVSELSGYHHGEKSLEDCIVGMAQNFVGSNNINLLAPMGNFGCLDPETEIIMWNSKIKKAKDILIGDELIGDDGTKRIVLQTTSGKDNMYKITTNKNDTLIVNSQHLLTLKFSSHKKIFWKPSNQTWKVSYFDFKNMKEGSKSISTINSSNLKSTYNKSNLTKEEAFLMITDYVNKLNIPDNDIFDIKVEDFLKLPYSTQKQFNCVYNSAIIEWGERQLPIDPYILGCWLGDGNQDGTGITSIDKEILKEWVKYMDSIDCELSHDIGDINHGNYHYSIRRKGFGFRRALGKENLNCKGCQSLKQQPICSWNSENNVIINLSNCIKKIKNYELKDDTYYIELNNNSKYRISKDMILELKYTSHNKIRWKNSDKIWIIEFFDQNYNLISKSSQNKDTLIKFQKNIPNIFKISLFKYLNLSKYAQSKLVPIENTFHNWIKILQENNLLKNKHIPEKFLINSKQNRLDLLAGFIDTDGCRKQQGDIYCYEITQSKRLRGHLIKSLEILCQSLGFRTSISERKTNCFTKSGQLKTQLSLIIYGNNLDIIPSRLERKQIPKSKRKIDPYINSFNIEYLGIGKFNGWQVDKNERFLLKNFLITHNSRLANGKDAAASRYIFTHLTPEALKIFDRKDLPLLNYLEDDGMVVEPSFYVPTLPMVLVNGAQGIGTGFSTFIPSYNPVDIKKNVMNLMNGKQLQEMKPWYKGFKGTIEKIDDYKYETYGVYSIEGKKIIITELPIGESITNYKDKIQKMDIHVDNLSDGDKVHLEFKVDNNFIKQLEKDPYTKLKLKSTLNTSNMHLFNTKGQIQKYNSTNDILIDYYNVRLSFYQKRKDFVLNELTEEIKYMMAKINFIKAVTLKKINMRKQTEEQVIQYLVNENFPTKEDNFNYLLNMPMRYMTKDQTEKLQNDIDKRNNEIDNLKNKTIKDLWMEDLS